MWLREAFEASEIGHTLSNVWSHGPREVIVYDKPGDRKFLPLGELLTQHRYKSASDPRDMVYSLLGLRDEIHGLEFEIDYRRTTSEVFIEAAKYVINTEKSIQLIAVTKLEKELCSNGQPLTMPTWTPNLGGSYYSKSMVSVLVLKQDAFIACGQTSAVAWVADDNVLSAKGVYVGTIQDIAELTPNYNDAEWDFLQTWRVLRDWWVKYLEWRPEDILSRIGEEGEFFDLMGMIRVIPSNLLLTKAH